MTVDDKYAAYLGRVGPLHVIRPEVESCVGIFEFSLTHAIVCHTWLCFANVVVVLPYSS